MNEFCLPVSESELTDLALYCARGDHHLADEMAQHVRVQHFRELYDAAKSSFHTWASWCMRCYRLSALRTRLVPTGDSLTDHPDDLASPDLDIDLTTPFCRPDLTAVMAWNARPRLVLLAWAGLWNKLPTREQEHTLRQAKVTNTACLPLLRHMPHSDRTRELASALALKPNSVVQIVLRGLDDLRGLRFLRELRGE